MRRALAITALAIAAVTAPSAQAVTLVYPNGQAVGGRWQRWADEAKVPTARVRVIFGPASLCDGAPNSAGIACSGGPLAADGGVPYELHVYDRYSLMFELGHIYDYGTLTNRGRVRFARLWGVPQAPWLDSTASVLQGREDGLEVDFAAVYAQCALGHRLGGLQSGDAPVIKLTPMSRTCDYIRAIASGSR